MAQLSSFATTASNVSVDSNERRITISNEVVNINGVLDPPTGFDSWGGWEIICQSSGGFRSTTGASGTLGGGKHSLKIVEKTNGHRFGGDNFSNSNGTNARFAGTSNNRLVYSNIVWIVEPGNRSDFDIGRGTSSDGSAGPSVVLTGVSVYMLTQAGQTAHFNHYSGNASIRIHEDIGYGLRMENRTNGPSWEFSTPVQSGAVVEGLVIANVASPTNNSSGSRAAVRLDAVAQNGTMTLTALNTPSIAAVDNAANASKTLLLIDPVGRPTRNDWSNQYHGIFEIRRTVPITFSGVSVPNNTPVYADGEGSAPDYTGSGSGSSGSVVVRTDLSPHNASGGAWTKQNQYKFYSLGYNFQKWATGVQTIANTPATIAATLTPDVFPNGDAVTALTTGSVSNISELYRALKTYGVANRLEPSADVSLVKIDSNKNIVIGTGATLDFNTTQTPLVVENNNRFTVKITATGLIGPDKDINSLNVGSGNTADVSVSGRLGVPLTDSTGTSSLITVNAPTNSRVTAYKSTGDQLGTSTTFPWNLLVSASDSASHTQVAYVATDKLREITRVTLDLSSGGSFSHTFTEGRAITDPLGADILSGVTAKTGLTTTMSSTFGAGLGRATISVPNSACSVKEVLKSFYDALITAAGGRFAATGRQLPSVTDLNGQTANLFLGADCQLTPSASANTESGISGFVFGGTGGNPQVANGSARVYYVPEVSGVGGDSGGGGASADAVWEYTLSEPTSGTFSPSSILAGYMFTDQAGYNAFGEGVKQVSFDSVSTYTNITTTATYYANRVESSGNYWISIYNTLANAETNDSVTGIVSVTGSGTPSGIVMRLERQYRGSAESNLLTAATNSGGGGGGGATAAQIWAYDISSLTGAKAGVVLNTAAADAKASKDNLEHADEGLSAVSQAVTSVKSSVESIKADVDSDDHGLEAIKEVVDDIDSPTAAEVAAAVSEYPIRGASNAYTVSSVSSGLIILSSAPTGFTNGDIVRVDNNGGYTALTNGREYYGAINTNTILALYESRANAIANQFTDFTNVGTNGVPGSVRLTHIAIAGNTGDIIGEIKTGVDAIPTTAPASPSAIATEVWTADTRTTTDPSPPTASAIATEVLNATIHEGQRAAYDFIPTAEDKSAFRVSAAAVNQLRNGDTIRFTNTGGYTEFTTGVDYYIYKAYNDIFVYRNADNAKIGNFQFVTISSNGTAANVRITRPADSGFITVKTAIDALLSNTDSTIHGIDAVLEELDGFTGADFVETGLSLQQAMQITTAILAGRLSVENNGTTYRFHRLDADSTAVIQSNASAAGRTIPTRDPA